MAETYSAGIVDVFPITVRFFGGTVGSPVAELVVPPFGPDCWQDCDREVAYPLTLDWTEDPFYMTPNEGSRSVGLSYSHPSGGVVQVWTNLELTWDRPPYAIPDGGVLALTWDSALFPGADEDVLGASGSLTRPGTAPVCWAAGQGSVNAAMANEFVRAYSDFRDRLRALENDQSVDSVVGAEGCVHRLDGTGPWSQMQKVWDDGHDLGNAALIHNDALGEVFALDVEWLAKYREAGGFAVLGAPTSNEYSAGDGTLRQDFDNGYISQSWDGTFTITLSTDSPPTIPPSPSSSPPPLPTTAPERKPVVVYLEGVGSTLDSAETGRATVEEKLNARGLGDYPVITYSYTGGWMSSLTGAPGPDTWDPHYYDCADTSQWIGDSANQLANMLVEYSESYPGTEFILVGHSLGGVIAWRTARDGVPGIEANDSRIAMVVTMGSPLDRPISATAVQVVLAAVHRECAIIGTMDTAMLAVSLEQSLTGLDNQNEAVRLENAGVVVLTYASTNDEIHERLGNDEMLRIETDSGGASCAFGEGEPPQTGHGYYIHSDLFWTLVVQQVQFAFEDGPAPTRIYC